MKNGLSLNIASVPTLAPSGVFPSLALNFLNTETLSSLVTFTRASGATRTNSAGTLVTMTDDQPRFDYDPSTLASNGLLIEEQRTNLVTYSEEFDNAAWTKTRSSIVADGAVAPDGTTTMDLLKEDTTAANTHFTSSAAVSWVGGTTYTISFYAKQGSGTRRIQVQWPNAAFTTTRRCNFNIDTLTVTPGSGMTASITNVGGGIYRCQVTLLADTTASASITFSLASTNAASAAAATYDGDGTSGIYLWGAQVEAGAFATSYISTVAAAATRAADSAVISTISPFYNQSDGTIYIETDYTLVAGGNYRFDVTDGTASNQMRLRSAPTGTTQSRFELTSGGTLWTTLSPATTNTAINKDAIAYATNNAAAVTNNGTLLSDLTVTPAVVDRITLGSTRAGASQLNGHIRRFAYYPTRLPDATLAALTV
jgi:hypothetical protein